MIKKISQFINILIFLCVLLMSPTSFVDAETINISAPKLVPHVEVSFSPTTGSFVEGATFEVPIIINTKGQNVNGIEIRISYDKNKLEVIRPAGGLSIIGLWVQPPTFDNTRGTANYTGVIPSGITTESGIVGMITFKAKSTGIANVIIDPKSKVLLNDGFGSQAIVETRKASYTIMPKAPDGIKVYSETHPFENRWYNNNSPVLSWEKDDGIQGFSFVLDNKPSTIPDNNISTQDITTAYTNLSDGLWYFHLKANKKGIWGATSHFLIRIDTTPPADFVPSVNYLLTGEVSARRALVSFFTTDNLSDIDHYEVGVIDKKQSNTVSPVFVETESPFQVPDAKDKDLEVVVRAIDKSGNIRDSSVAIVPPFVITQYIKEYMVYILGGIILLGLFMLMIHYLVGRHIFRYLKKARLLMKKEELVELEKEVKEEGGGE